MISEEGIEPDLDKVEAVRNFPIPTSARAEAVFRNSKLLQSICAKFCQNSSPLTQENVHLFWSMTC